MDMIKIKVILNLINKMIALLMIAKMICIYQKEKITEKENKLNKKIELSTKHGDQIISLMFSSKILLHGYQSNKHIDNQCTKLENQH